jgi:hypothetical protein
MGSWSLDAFLDGDASTLTLDDLVRHCIAATGRPAERVEDRPSPFDDNERHGVVAFWGAWHAMLMLLDEETTRESAEWLQGTRTPPAATRRSVLGCTRSLRVIFGSDDSRDYTNHIIDIMSWLEELSANRVYDPQQHSFTNHVRKKYQTPK